MLCGVFSILTAAGETAINWMMTRDCRFSGFVRQCLIRGWFWRYDQPLFLLSGFFPLLAAFSNLDSINLLGVQPLTSAIHLQVYHPERQLDGILQHRLESEEDSQDCHLILFCRLQDNKLVLASMLCNCEIGHCFFHFLVLSL